jgi:hypothetical protein
MTIIKPTVLAPPHRPPRLRQEYEDLRSEAQHAAMIAKLLADDPLHFQRNTDNLPYGVFFLESGEEVLFDAEYSPMWRRQGEGHRATECDPAAFTEWFAVFWFHDGSLTPLEKDFNWKRSNISSNTQARAFLRNQLTIIKAEFVAGGPLLVRALPRVPVYAGDLISRHPIPPRRNVVLPFRRR